MQSQKKMLTGAPIEEKIAWAGSVYQELGGGLLCDPSNTELLERLKDAVRVSHDAMKETGMARICTACDENEGGSCCGAGMENKYDGALLLINLLLGVDIFTKRKDAKSCLFLDGEGCRLLARHVICVNYICGKITQAIDAGALAALREKEGVELETLFVLHERIKKVLANGSC